MKGRLKGVLPRAHEMFPTCHERKRKRADGLGLGVERGRTGLSFPLAGLAPHRWNGKTSTTATRPHPLSIRLSLSSPVIISRLSFLRYLHHHCLFIPLPSAVRRFTRLLMYLSPGPYRCRRRPRVRVAKAGARMKETHGQESWSDWLSLFLVFPASLKQALVMRLQSRFWYQNEPSLVTSMSSGKHFFCTRCLLKNIFVCQLAPR